jgi:hypothetical protein
VPEVRLSDCDIAIINLPAQTERRASAGALLQGLGLKYRFIEAIACSPGPIGCGLSHIRALRDWRCDRPLLLLEDDVALSDDLVDTILAPGDADAIYLGASTFGAVEPFEFAAFTNAVLAEPASDGLVRIYNMLSAHAILYLTESARVIAIEAMTAAMIDRGWPPDRGLAAAQARFNVYALQRPLFYQSAALQRPDRALPQEAATKVVVPVYPEGSILDVAAAAGAVRLQATRVGRALTWAKVD